MLKETFVNGLSLAKYIRGIPEYGNLTANGKTMAKYILGNTELSMDRIAWKAKSIDSTSVELKYINVSRCAKLPYFLWNTRLWASFWYYPDTLFPVEYCHACQFLVLSRHLFPVEYSHVCEFLVLSRHLIILDSKLRN